jgi:uncharacterized protein Yka (UPF0111/DUF47 family)
MPPFGLSIFPKNARFYDLFANVAQVLVRSSEEMCDLFDRYDNVEIRTKSIQGLENEADNITHGIYTLMNQTFVTPLDREDIAALAQRMDDVVDFIEATSTSMVMYGIASPTEAARGMADLVRLQCLQIAEAIAVLRERRKLSDILGLAREINRLENEGDKFYLQATAELFDGELSAVDIIKWREIYDELESSLDSCENVAHILEAIVLKHG